jgi:hypothetical protein
LLAVFGAAGLRVLSVHPAPHPRIDTTDPLHTARMAEEDFAVAACIKGVRAMSGKPRAWILAVALAVSLRHSDLTDPQDPHTMSLQTKSIHQIPNTEHVLQSPVRAGRSLWTEQVIAATTIFAPHCIPRILPRGGFGRLRFGLLSLCSINAYACLGSATDDDCLYGALLDGGR